MVFNNHEIELIRLLPAQHRWIAPLCSAPPPFVASSLEQRVTHTTGLNGVVALQRPLETALKGRMETEAWALQKGQETPGAGSCKKGKLQRKQKELERKPKMRTPLRLRGQPTEALKAEPEDSKSFGRFTFLKTAFRFVALLGLIVKLLSVHWKSRYANHLDMKNMTGKQKRKARPRIIREKKGRKCTSADRVKRVEINASTREDHTGSRAILRGFQISTSKAHT